MKELRSRPAQLGKSREMTFVVNWHYTNEDRSIDQLTWLPCHHPDFSTVFCRSTEPQPDLMSRQTRTSEKTCDGVKGLTSFIYLLSWFNMITWFITMIHKLKKISSWLLKKEKLNVNIFTMSLFSVNLHSVYFSFSIEYFPLQYFSAIVVILLFFLVLGCQCSLCDNNFVTDCLHCFAIFSTQPHQHCWHTHHILPFTV